MCWHHPCKVALRALLILVTLRLDCYIVTATMPGSSKFYTIHWNLTNPIFRIDNTDNVIDVNRNNLQFEYDQVNLICPVYTTEIRDEDMEKYIIYNVSKDEYETCRITNPNPRIIAVCDKPYKLMYFTITFRPYTPQPGGLEFLPGHDYYFISTSTGDDLHRRIGGRCTTHNMKIVFKVWSPPPQVTPPLDTVTTTAATVTSSSDSSVRLPWPSPTPVTAVAAAASEVTVRSVKKVVATATGGGGFEKHPNEVGVSEELTLGGGSGGGGTKTDKSANTSTGIKSQCSCSSVVLLLLAVVLMSGLIVR